MKYLRVHLESHLTVYNFTCKICHKKFKRNAQLAAHSRIHLERPPTFPCDLCPKILKTASTLSLHRKRHLEDYVRTCDACNQGFMTTQSYNHHMNAKHGPATNICHICGRSCYSKAVLKTHMLRHQADYKIKQIKCEFCPKKFSQGKYIRQHIKRMHETVEGFVCNLCGKKVTSKTGLRTHMLIHEGVRPKKCPFCEKAFTALSTLTGHMRTHTGARPYKCEKCGKDFAQRSALTRHERSHSIKKG